MLVVEFIQRILSRFTQPRRFGHYRRIGEMDYLVRWRGTSGTLYDAMRHLHPDAGGAFTERVNDTLWRVRFLKEHHVAPHELQAIDPMALQSHSHPGFSRGPECDYPCPGVSEPQ